jgi:hypothetical protein
VESNERILGKLRIYPMGDRINQLLKHYNLEFKSDKLRNKFIENKIGQLILEQGSKASIIKYNARDNCIYAWDKPTVRA